MRVAPLRLGRLLVPVMAACLLPSPLLAAWQPNGIPVGPDATNVIQNIPDICSDGASGAYVSWRETSTTDPANARLQRITSEGDIAAGWPGTGLRIGSDPNYEFICNTASDLSGGAYVIWFTDVGGVLTYRLLRIASNGTIAPGWPLDGVTLPVDPYDQQMDDLCGDGEGGLFIAWSAPSDVILLHYSATGAVAPGWPAAGRPIISESSIKGGAQLLPTVDGGVLASWIDLRGGSGLGYVRYALKITSAGEPAPQWPAGGVKVNSLPTAVEIGFLVSDGAGGAFIGWNDNRNGVVPSNPLDYDIYAQHVLGDGTLDARWPASGLPVCTAASAQYFFEMAEDGSGGAIFVWDDYRSNAPQIYATRLRPDATVAPGWTPNGAAMSPFSATQTIPDAVGDGAGGVYGIWEENSLSIVGQHLSGAGVPASGWMGSGNVIAGDVTCNLPVATSDGKGGALVAYRRSQVTPERKTRIYLQRVYGDVATATRAAFLDAEVAPGTARLRWTVSDAMGARAWVERRQDSEEWSSIGSPDPVGESVLGFEDRGLAPGRYAYRLGVGDGGVESFSAEAWVEIPSAFSLELSGFRPNPAVCTPSLVFTLPDDKAARLDVFDVKGRVVSSREVGGLGAGVHTVPLAGEAWNAGMYWIRLSHPDRTLTTKGLIAH